LLSLKYVEAKKMANPKNQKAELGELLTTAKKKIKKPKTIKSRQVIKFPQELKNVDRVKSLQANTTKAKVRQTLCDNVKEVFKNTPIKNGLFLCADEWKDIKELHNNNIKIKNVHSIEHDPDVYERAKANVPYILGTKFHIHKGGACDVIKQRQFNAELIWLDFMNGITPTALIDLQQITSNLLPTWEKFADNKKPAAFFLTYSMRNLSKTGMQILKTSIPKRKKNPHQEQKEQRGNLTIAEQWETIAGLTYFLNSKVNPWCSLKPITSVYYYTRLPMILLGFEIQPLSNKWEEALNSQELTRMFSAGTNEVIPPQQLLAFA
jgi:hypothetical protein